ncbi:MAG TPA: VWA domain-containing protein [Roseiflexaceae bacterium]|nr:VWA domain-containing protein [Roseiflexaceae bacterium]HMP41261.1 VWA domain-containing protein [Roseiflexaceae bacterium]
MAGEVTLHTLLARPSLPTASTPQVAYILLEVMPGQLVANMRMPVNVAFVLDRSGSMKGEKIDRVRRATARAVELLGDQDVTSIVIFDHRTEVLVSTTSAANPGPIAEKISRIRDSGGTRIAPAIEQGLREIEKGPPNAIRRMLLLTDGQTEHEQECLRQADAAGRNGVPITALGVGKDWNEDLMIEIGNRSGGTADYIGRPDEIDEYFSSTVQRAQAATVQNATLTLRLVQGVLPRAVWQVIPLINNLGYRPVSDRDVSVPLGEVESGSGRALLIELLIDPRPVGQYRIGQAEVSYDVPLLGLQGERTRSDIMLGFSADPAATAQVNPAVMNIVEKISAFKLQTRALQDLAAGNVGGATQKLQSAVTRLLNQGEVDLAQTMQQEIANLEQNGQLSSEGQKTMKFGTRKTVRLSDIEHP